MGVNMKRVIAVAACGFMLTACTSWMPSFDLPSMPSFGGGGGGPVSVSLAVESDPPGAQASVQGGASCVTPCRLNVAANGPFAVNVALNGYIPQSVPVRVMQPDDPRLGPEDNGSAGPRLDPNPVYVELERAPPPPPPPHKAKPKPKRPAVAKRTPPPGPPQQPAANAPSAPTNAVAPPPPPPPQQPAANSTAPWPMPK
jgi:PEGA domain-containing protein